MDIRHDRRGPLAVLTLDRPTALNALNLEMIRALDAALDDIATDPGVGAVLLRGAGGKAFCAGGDLRALYEAMQRQDERILEFFVEEYTLDFRLHMFAKPVIADVDGITMGGGMGLAQGATLRIAGERTRIAMPEVAIGLFPDVGGSYFLSRLSGALGAYLALTGAQLRAADALYVGLADRYLPPEGIEALAEQLAGAGWQGAPRAAAERALGEAARELPSPPLAPSRAAIEHHFRHPTAAAIVESLERETDPARVEWARTTASLLRARSPFMLEVTRRLLDLGRESTLADCFRRELGLIRRCLARGEFREGIRAVIVDKDNAPRWSPPRLEDVDFAEVEAFLADPWAGAAHPLAALGGSDRR